MSPVPMIPTEVIRRKRDGEALTQDDITEFLGAYTRGDLPDYQMAALAMAVYFRGLTAAELAWWTDAMLHSGDVLDLSDVPGRKVDKHSTGGVGDKISLPLMPLVAACGIVVPSIAGRGLGHTGGTLDKLEAIPGFNCRLETDAFRRVLKTVGCAIIGQTSALAPADRKLYSLRDVTSTVESIPLISSSIMSKKLAEGIDGLVLDVKFGSGAFMRDIDRARELAKTMVGIGRSFGKNVVAYLTDMNQPLGSAVGNALEIFETVEVLRGGGPPDVVELTMVLGAEMLIIGGAAEDRPQARAKLAKAIASGAGLEKFQQMVAAQGGDAHALTDWSRMPNARTKVEVHSLRSGFLGAMQVDEVGRAAMLLGAGRQRVEDTIDPAVGISLHKRTGERVSAGDVLATLHVNDGTTLDAARIRLLRAMPVVDAPPTPGPLVAERIAAG